MPSFAVNPWGKAASPHGGKRLARTALQHSGSQGWSAFGTETPRAAALAFRELEGSPSRPGQSKWKFQFAGLLKGSTSPVADLPCCRGLRSGEPDSVGMDRDRSGGKPSRAMQPLPDAGGGGIELNMWRHLLSVRLPLSQHSVSRKCSFALVVAAPCRRGWPFASASASTTLLIALALGSGLELLEANPLPHRSIWPTAVSVLCPQGRTNPGVLTRKPRIKDAGRGKRGGRSRLHARPFPGRVSASPRGGSNPVR